MGEQVDPPDLKSGSRKGVLVRAQLGRPEHGEVGEWFIPAVLKTAVSAMAPSVQIRPSPPINNMLTVAYQLKAPSCEEGEGSATLLGHPIRLGGEVVITLPCHGRVASSILVRAAKYK